MSFIDISWINYQLMFEIPVRVDKHNTYSTVLMQVDSLSKLDTRNSILDPRFSKTSRLELSFQTFEAVREFIELSFETFEWEKQRTFRAINF